VATPSSSTDGVNKAYVDNLTGGTLGATNTLLVSTGTGTAWQTVDIVTKTDGLTFNSSIVHTVRSKGSFFVQTADHRIISWGNNDWGQLGQGSPNTKDLASEIMFPPIVQGVSIAKFESLGSTLVVLFSNGYMYGWGSNYSGQLGQNNTTEGWQPVLIDTGVSTFYHPPQGEDIVRQSITTFGNATLFYKKTATPNIIYVCGENGFGNIGIGLTTNQLFPLTLSYSAFPTLSATDVLVNIFVGEFTGNTTFAIWRNAAGTTYKLFSCGHNGSYGLGLGTTSTADKTTWNQVTTYDVSGTTTSIPTSVIQSIVSIQSGGYEYNGTTTAYRNWSIMTTWDGTNTKIYTCGYNASGQCGDGTTTNRGFFKLVYTGPNGASPVKTLRMFANAVVLLSDGSIVAWGDNSHRQLNAANTTDVTTPVRTTGSVTNIFNLTPLYFPENPMIAVYTKTATNVLSMRGFNRAGTAGAGNVFIGAAMTTWQQPMINTTGLEIDNMIMTSPPSTNSTATVLVSFKNSSRLLFAGDSNDYESNTTLTTSKYAFCSLPLGNILGT